MKTDKKKSKPKRKTKPKSESKPKSKKETSEMEALEAFFMTKPKNSKKKSTAGFVEPDEKELVDLGSGKDDELDSGETTIDHQWEQYCHECGCSSSVKHIHCSDCEEQLTEEHHECLDYRVPMPQFSDQLRMGYQTLENNNEEKRKYFAQINQKYQVLEQERKVLDQEVAELTQYEYARTGNLYKLVDGHYTDQAIDSFAEPDKETKDNQYQIRFKAWRICEIKVEQIEMREQLRFTICKHDFMQTVHNDEWTCSWCGRHVYGFELKKILDGVIY